MEDTSGFYKYDEEQWFYAPNAVYAPTYTLLRELKDTYDYPVDGHPNPMMNNLIRFDLKNIFLVIKTTLLNY
jgi:hypothetical protein